MTTCERCGGTCVSRERFDQEHRAYIAAEFRYMKLREWIDTAPTGAIASEAYEYALRCVPDRTTAERGLAAMDAAHAAFSTLSDVKITETATNAIKEARQKKAYKANRYAGYKPAHTCETDHPEGYCDCACNNCYSVDPISTADARSAHPLGGQGEGDVDGA